METTMYRVDPMAACWIPLTVSGGAFEENGFSDTVLYGLLLMMMIRWQPTAEV
jgi:hypothetical protein